MEFSRQIIRMAMVTRPITAVWMSTSDVCANCQVTADINPNDAMTMPSRIPLRGREFRSFGISG